MLVGIQGSGKSQISRQLEQQGYIVASNDRSQLIVICLSVLKVAVSSFLLS